jgi:two-component system sensor histidine kinase UhpB
LSCGLLVATGYYVGAQIGFRLTPHGQPISTFWPPNAILLAALLLVPPRKWWTLLLAVFPVHMLAQLHTGVPGWTAVGWFLTNCSEALFGAFCITRLIDPKQRFDSVRGIYTFITFGVVIAPLASSFLDAASVVITHWGRGYWTLGIERFWGNALTELTIVPIVVLSASRGASWIRKAKLARVGEASLLAIGTVSLVLLIFRLQPGSLVSAPGLLYLALPFFLWAAVRFGPAGLSFSVLATALISLGYTMHGREPFPHTSMAQNILSLQILFCTAVVPLMFLSAVMTEARRTQELLRQSSSQLIAAQEQERHRIARELHDDLGQRLALLNVRLKALLEEPDTPLKPAVSDLVDQVEVIASTTRDISHGLYPSQLEYIGLPSAVRRLCDDVGRGRQSSISLEIGTLPQQLGPSVSVCIYRVLQEALQNILRHSHANNVHVKLGAEKTRILLTITDDGIGFDAMQKATGMGILSMRQRVESLGGAIDIASGGNTGTRINVQLPFQQTNLPDSA